MNKRKISPQIQSDIMEIERNLQELEREVADRIIKIGKLTGDIERKVRQWERDG